MTTVKPLPNSKPKKPLYYDEVVQIYDVVKVKARTDHNPTDALEELKKQLTKKKAVKARLLAREEAIQFKKKGVGKSPKIKRIPYSAVKSFYQFTTSPAFVVLGVQGNDIPKQYVILAAPSVEKANRLTEILQVGQLAPNNNLKNQIPPLELRNYVRDESPWSPISSSHSHSSRRYTPSQSSHRHKSSRKNSSSTTSHSSRVKRSRSSSKRRSYSFPSYSEKQRAASADSPNIRKSGGYIKTGSSSPSPQRYNKKTISVSTSTLIQIPISRNSSSPDPVPKQDKSMSMGYNEDRSFFIYYNPPSRMRKTKKSKSRGSDTPVFYFTPDDSSSSEDEKERKISRARSEARPGIYLMANKKPKVKRVKKLKKRSASEDTRLSSKIYYFSLNDSSSSSSSSSSSDSEEETYVLQRSRKSVQSSPRRSRRSSNRSWRSPPRGRYSSSSSSSSSSSIRRRSSSSSSSSRSRSYKKKRRGKITNVPIVYCFPTRPKSK
nr:expressed conserved protein [Hymenolepis microstoma]